MERYTIFVTTNHSKIIEAQPHFERYGIKVIQYNISTSDDDETVIKYILEKNPNINIFAVIRESTFLYQKGKHELADISRNFQAVNHLSILNVSLVKNNVVTERTCYEYYTPGVIRFNYNNEPTNDENIFGWDDIFYLDSCQKNYHELRKLGIKISSRDMVISEFLKNKVYYRNLIDLKHNPLKLNQSISFETTGLITMYSDLLSNNVATKLYGVDKIIKFNFQEGSYVSSPMNRRIKLNWNPGLNPIPLVRKEKDPLHEITYAIHDMGHFAFRPDLLFTGCHDNQETEKLNRKLYLINRMMSEAITLIFADMFFVKSVLESGNDYPTRNERKIYPLFEKILENKPMTVECDFSDDCTIQNNLIPYYKEIMHANTKYCLLGDKTKYLELLGDEKPEFNDFDKKYSQFFIQDYRWTNQNYKQMIKDSNLHKKWWSLVSNINDKFSLGLISIDTFRISLAKFKPHRLNNDKLVDLVFNYVFENNVVPVFTQEYSDSIKNNLTKAFIRYLCNQIFIFIKYNHVPLANDYLCTIMKLIDDIYLKNIMTDLQLINDVRSYIKTFLDNCIHSNAMTIDDASTYNQLYSIVDPFIVDYDKEYKWPLDLVSTKILNGDDSGI
ncbi:hypothetical protein QJ856_gp0097 [Tupanvirus deep ocean]|uniref:Uncharacterized protein n=2 Tax=Tupanvirus TaxID=2094720 RepID=A0AC62AA37_9VIRU|nr:hypothetical protein QJ856_gp0097 [Tupanvirus deep ocean]QKU34630.1 hypothetical protein [Tupanvirus deep ocean]